MGFEPPETMYPEDRHSLHFEKSEDIWQVKHITGTMFFIKAGTPQEAYDKIMEVLLEMEKATAKGQFQWRRLPILSIRR